MAQAPGMGAKLKITITAVLTLTANLLDVEFPAQKLTTVEATPHSASGGYAVFLSTGKRELTEFKVTLGWDDTEATHAAYLAALGTNSAVVFTIEDATPNEVITFSAFVVEIARQSKQDSSLRAEVTLRPTGAPSIA